MTSRKQEYRDLMTFAYGEYKDAFVGALGDAVENGEIVGLEQVPKATIRGLFDQIDPAEWYAAAIEDPDAAGAMLAEYSEVSQ